MGKIVLRGRIGENGQIELLEPLPPTVTVNDEVSVVIGEKPTVYETVNEYGDRVIVDEEDGSVTPVEPVTLEELKAGGFIGIWADRREEIGDSVEWLKEQRRKQREKNDPWRGRHLS